jgi:serine protease Do
MENIEKKSSENENNFVPAVVTPSKKRRRGVFFVAGFIIVTFLISATSGAIFGFIASKSGVEVLGNLRSGNFEEIFSARSENPGVIRQSIIQEDSAVIEVVKKTSPAVVSIVITKDISNVRSFGFPDFFGDPFDFFNDNGSGGTQQQQQQQKVGGGTGFFITDDGMIVTNRHVVEDSNASYTVVTNDNQEYPARVLAVDPVNDIAVIKVDGNGFSTLSMGNSDDIQIGQTVVAIGNSLAQFSNTVSRGIISGLGRNVTAGGNLGGQTERLTNIIQTDAAINPGNSGGPLLNINGDVIGINVAIAQGAQNIGFAIPSNQVKKISDQVKETGRISTPFIGVRYIPVNDDLQKENDLPYNYGNLIIRGEKMTDFAVIPGSPADKAGIVENDIILEVNGEKIEDDGGKSLLDLISKYKVGDTVKLKVWHRGEIKEVRLTLEERRQQNVQSSRR